jgi:Cys-tRNA(Pro) deacylase
VQYTEHEFEYKEHGGTSHSSSSLGVPEHSVVKTLIMEDEKGGPLVVLMHGDRKVSTKELARQAGVKRIAPCKPETATRHSGYLIGGTSPFGTRKAMPVFLEKSVLALPRIYINGGRRGYLLGMDPAELTRVLAPKLVEVGIEE